MAERHCERLDHTGRHDWRVDPRQVITTTVVGGVELAELRVVCASCGEEAQVRSRRRFVNDPDDPRTWRPYLEGT